MPSAQLAATTRSDKGKGAARKLRSAGYGEINNGEKGIYYCRKVRAVSEGVVNDCFQFDVRIPRSKEESKDKDKDSPGEKDAPARPAGRVAYG